MQHFPLLTVLAMTPQQKAETLVVTTVHARVFSGAAGITFADQKEARCVRC
jgi:hypothetical protein